MHGAPRRGLTDNAFVHNECFIKLFLILYYDYNLTIKHVSVYISDLFVRYTYLTYEHRLVYDCLLRCIGVGRRSAAVPFAGCGLRSGF